MFPMFQRLAQKVRTVLKMAKRSNALRLAERFCLTMGLLLLGFYIVARLHGVVTLHAAMRSFAESRVAEPAGSGTSETSPKTVDYSLWAPSRIKAYKESLSHPAERPLAVLRIPKLRLVAPVRDGLDSFTLNSGVGLIPGTTAPGEAGNIGIAGHRDGFFRGLKNIAKGDTIELVTAHKTDVYVVADAFPTDRYNIDVLRPGPKPAVTLVTCYPFYFVGAAPKRYIVQAFKRDAERSGGL